MRRFRRAMSRLLRAIIRFRRRWQFSVGLREVIGTQLRLSQCMAMELEEKLVAGLGRGRCWRRLNHICMR